MRKTPALIIELVKSAEKIGQRHALTIDWARIQTVIDKIVRGLFWKHTQRRLPADYVVQDIRYKPQLEPAFQAEIVSLPLFQVGDGSVFSYRYYLPDAEGSESCWFLMFYNDTSLFLTCTAQAS